MAVFLDYDGTLTPIVERPEDALLPAETRAAIERLAALAPVAIVSGRDLADVRRLIGIEGITYAGSHGFDVVLPDGSAHQRGTEFLPALEAAERDLRARLASVPGAQIEAKTFAIAVHVRRVREELVPDVEAAVAGVAAADPRLRRTGGKKVFEIRPAVAWDKGKALLWLLDVLELGPGVLPVYVGDDETDEDAFRAVRDRGLGVVVRGEGDDRPTLARYPARLGGARAFVELLIDALSGGRRERVVADLRGLPPDGGGAPRGALHPGERGVRHAKAAPEAGADEVHYPGTYAAGVYDRLRTEIGAGASRTRTS